jgi:predicted RNA-binding protein with PUA-like domain
MPREVKRWLMKTEPETFSIDDLKRVRKEPWSGVRGYQARNYMRDEMRVGDTVLFYHSSCPVPGIYGEASVVSLPYPDPTQFDAKSPYYDPKAKKDKPIWYLVDVAFVKKLETPITLAAIRANPKLKTMVILQPGSRLSITPVSEKEFVTLRGIEPRFKP